MIGIAEESSSGATRPVDLPLFENDDKVTEMKRVGKGKNQKTRLLSVPNIKYQKNDGTLSTNAKTTEEFSTGESFAGNLMRRISKCFNTNVETIKKTNFSRVLCIILHVMFINKKSRVSCYNNLSKKKYN